MSAAKPRPPPLISVPRIDPAAGAITFIAPPNTLPNTRPNPGLFVWAEPGWPEPDWPVPDVDEDGWLAPGVDGVDPLPESWGVTGAGARFGFTVGFCITPPLYIISRSSGRLGICSEVRARTVLDANTHDYRFPSPEVATSLTLPDLIFAIRRVLRWSGCTPGLPLMLPARLRGVRGEQLAQGPRVSGPGEPACLGRHPSQIAAQRGDSVIAAPPRMRS